MYVYVCVSRKYTKLWILIGQKNNSAAANLLVYVNMLVFVSDGPHERKTPLTHTDVYRTESMSCLKTHTKQQCICIYICICLECGTISSLQWINFITLILSVATLRTLGTEVFSLCVSAISSVQSNFIFI